MARTIHILIGAIYLSESWLHGSILALILGLLYVLLAFAEHKLRPAKPEEAAEGRTHPEATGVGLTSPARSSVPARTEHMSGSDGSSYGFR